MLKIMKRERKKYPDKNSLEKEYYEFKKMAMPNPQKQPKYYVNLLVSFEKHHFQMKTALVTFKQIWVKNDNF